MPHAAVYGKDVLQPHKEFDADAKTLSRWLKRKDEAKRFAGLLKESRVTAYRHAGLVRGLGGNLGVVWVAATTRDSDKEAVQHQTGTGDEATEPGETIEEDQRDSVLLNDERIVEVQRSLPRRLFVF